MTEFEIAFQAHVTAFERMMMAMTLAGSVTNNDPDHETAEPLFLKADEVEAGHLDEATDYAPSNVAEMARLAMHCATVVAEKTLEYDPDAEAVQALAMLKSAALVLAAREELA